MDEIWTRPGDAALLAEALAPDAHAIALIGSGGKTSLMEALGRGLSATHPGCTCALTTTTHLWPPEKLPLIDAADSQEALVELRDRHLAYVAHCCCVKGEAKLEEPCWGLSPLLAGADFVLVEADGSHMLPLKAHGPHEPAVPSCCTSTILVLGASGFGRPIREAVHRPALFAGRAGCSEEDTATSGRCARVISAEIASGQIAFDCIFVNQAETAGALKEAEAFASALSLSCPDLPIWAGSAHMAQARRIG